MTTDQIKEAIATIRELAGNTMFRVRFIKRTTGKPRDMVCRLDVNKYVKGTTSRGRTYEFEEKGLLPVYDVQKRQYRTVPVDAIISLTIRGVEYQGIKDPEAT